MGPAADLEPVSPELALVCDELRERARAGLPVRDPDAFLPRSGARAQPQRAARRENVQVTISLPPWLAAVVYVLVMSSAHFARGFVAIVVIVALLTVFVSFLT